MADEIKSSHDFMPGLWIGGTVGTATAAFAMLGFFMDTHDRGYSYNHTAIPKELDNATAFDIPIILAANRRNFLQEYCKHQDYMCTYVNMDFKHHHDPSAKGYEPLLYTAGFLSLALAAYHTYRIFSKAEKVKWWCTAIYVSVFAVVWVSVAFGLSAILTTYCFDLACEGFSKGHSWEKTTKAPEVFISIGLAMAFISVAGLHWDHAKKSAKDLTENTEVAKRYGAWAATCRFLLAFALTFQFGLAVQYMSHDLEKDPLCKRNDEFNEVAYWLFTVSTGIGFVWALIVFFQFVESTIIFIGESGQGMLPEWYHSGSTKVSMPLIFARFILLGASLIVLVNARISTPNCQGLVQQVQELVDEKDRWQMFAIILIEALVVLSVAATVRVSTSAAKPLAM